MFFVYVLYSENFNKIYIGFTSDIDKRLIAHNHSSNKGWTKDFKPWKLIHTECLESKRSAMLREKQLKSQKGREYIRAEILKIF
jgi:putative endonuclease